MLRKITLENFTSFKERTSLDFTKTNYTILPQNVASCGVLKGSIFVGANASGKSNLLRAIRLLLDCLFSESNISLGNYLCLFNDKPSYRLEYEFFIQNHVICYAFEFSTNKKILTEKLFIDNTLLLERMGTAAKSYIADSDGLVYNESDVPQDGLFLRTLYFNTKFTSNPILQKWMEFLSNSIYVNQLDNSLVSYNKENLKLSKYLENDGCKKINDFFDSYQFGQHIEYTNTSSSSLYVVQTSDNQKTIIFKRQGVEAPIPFALESTGNQALLQLLPVFFKAIAQNSLLLIDEFSSSFHNELEELLIKFFMTNAAESQLFFVSHSTNLLNNTLLRPDQEFAVEFHGNNGSRTKRFSAEQPRSAQNIEKMYESGIFGGLPSYKEVENEDK